MAQFTNMYAHQQNRNIKHASTNEIQILFGLHIIIGCLNKFPRVRLYWEKVLGLRPFLDNMARDRFFQLRSCLHLVDNLARPQNCVDKLYKVRPIINAVKKRINQLDMEEVVCVDEQMIPFTGQLSIKQYIKGKPTPWGIKVFVLCGKSGQPYDFIVYQGQSTGIDPNKQKTFGLGGSIILDLCERINHEGHRLFFDNYFSSYTLFLGLTEKKIFAAGTIRLIRFQTPPLMSDREIKKKGRGFSDEVVSEDNIVITKWLDNKPVYMASNFIGKGSEDKVRRWEKKTSEYIEVNRPQVIREYNHGMGGVDLLDQLISQYRIFIRSKKWTLRVIMHFVDFALASSWLEYRRDYRKAHPTSTKNMLDLLGFRVHVAESLLYVNKNVIINRRGTQLIA